MPKSSVEWQELHGLRTYIQHLRYVEANATGNTLIDTTGAIRMAEMRIKELEDKGA